jgi:hypothetical protein
MKLGHVAYEENDNFMLYFGPKTPKRRISERHRSRLKDDVKLIVQERLRECRLDSICSEMSLMSIILNVVINF